MEIIPTNNTVTTAAAPPASDTNPNPTISSDFETFLKMLTVQMQNQDPLNPIDSSDYAVQLATFSGVEQQVQTNDLLQSLTQQIGLMGLSQLSGWVGMEARVAAPVYFDGEPIDLTTKVAPGTDQAFVVIKNESGQEIQRNELDLPAGDIQWAGVDSDGNPFPAGQYSFYVESRAVGEVLSTEQATAYAEIKEARSVDGEIFLVLEGGAEVPADTVTALRGAG